MVRPPSLLDRFGLLTPRLVYALAMQGELSVRLPVATAPRRSGSPGPPADTDRGATSHGTATTRHYRSPARLRS